MAARNETQFEKLIDEATRRKDFELLEQYLETEECENVSHKCSKQFVNKLDKLLCQELDKQEFKTISTLLNSLWKCGEKISIAGEDGLPAMIKYGLIGKVKGILILRGNENNKTLTTLAEDFFNVLLAVYDSRPEGKMQMLENFVLRTCTLIADVRISIYVQQEVVRKLNLMLDNMPRDARKKIFSTKEMLPVMSDMGRRILDAGDYDLQVAITEALCRMIPEKQRRELACQWFSMEFVSNAFKGIKDSEFETDCRKFLNQVNGMLGDKRRVFTYPCLSAALDKYELQIPLDENLEEFWIDFNIGSRSISFYVAADNADHQWETVIIPEEEVVLYNLEEKDSKKLLTIDLKSPMNVGNQEGEKIFLNFDSILEIKDVTGKVYGLSKCKGFSKKQSSSVAKTTVHVVFDESGSQVLVPESQFSPHLEEKSEEEKLSKYKSQQLPGTQRTLCTNNNQDKHKGSSSKITTSCKRKVSEASVLIPGTTRFPMRSPLLFVSTSTPCKGRFKLPLKMMSSADRSNSNDINETRTKNVYKEPTGNGQRHVSDNEFFETEQNVRKSKIRDETKLPEKGKCNEEVLKNIEEAENGATRKQALDDALDIVPDSQPTGRSNKHLLPGLLESSSDKKRTWKKRACSVPENNITTGSTQKLNLSSGPTSHTVPVFNERDVKQNVFYSICGNTSPDKQINANREKQQKNGIQITREENCKILSGQSKSINNLELKQLSTEIKNISTTAETFKTFISARVSETSLHSDFTKYSNTEEEADVLSGKETSNSKQSKMKTKSKEMTDATKSLISKISDRYKEKTNEKSKTSDSSGFNRPCLSKSCFSVNKEKVQNRSLKTTTFLDTTSGHTVDDVYNFNISGFDEPTIKIQDCHVKEQNICTDPKKKGNPDEIKTSTEMKAGKKTRNNRDKKHLFSDTDTEYRGDDSKTDISWLQESKSKPQLIDYSRNKNLGKSISAGKTDKFSEPACRMDTSKGKTAKKKKETERKKQAPRQDNMIEQTYRTKRPRKAALAKNYKEPSSSEESESEREYSACTSKKEKSKIQKPMNEENRDRDQQKKFQNTVSLEPKIVVDYVNKAFIKSKNFDEEKEIEMSLPESPASLETMRGAERLSEGDVTQEHISIEGSPGLQESTPKNEETLNFGKGISPNNLCPQKKSFQNMCLNQSPEMTFKKLTVGNKSFSPVMTASSLLNLTPVTPYKTVSGKHTKESVSETCDANENLSFGHGFSDKLSVEGKLQDITKPIIKNKREEPSPLSVSSGNKIQSWSQECYGPVHESGPTIHTFLKRRYQSDTESHSDEVETSKKEEKKRTRRPKLQPKKLFKTDDTVTYRVSESLSTVSVLGENVWEPGYSTLSMCQKFQKEFTKKMESRSQKMDHFTKQSLRAAHQHLATMNYQLHECRIRQLDKFHLVILEEIENFEKDSQSLKNMEKEFLAFWKKQKQTLSTYLKNEQQRFQILKTSFEKNIYRTVDYEERIFTSQMHLMKEDMKGLQEKFLKEMQEEELINVRRGLQTLFLSEDREF